jgi:hypothetical protein
MNGRKVHLRVSRYFGKRIAANMLTIGGSRWKHSPHSPQTPTQNPGDGEVGNDGNGGNEIPANE